MSAVSKWLLTDKEKDHFIAALTPRLAILRTQAGVSQEELANLIGISRQTYSAIERKNRKMSWNTYLSLILFYDYNRKTHQLMRHLSLFPTELILHLNGETDFSGFELSEASDEVATATPRATELDAQPQEVSCADVHYGNSCS